MCFLTLSQGEALRLVTAACKVDAVLHYSNTIIKIFDGQRIFVGAHCVVPVEKQMTVIENKLLVVHVVVCRSADAERSYIGIPRVGPGDW